MKLNICFLVCQRDHNQNKEGIAMAVSKHSHALTCLEELSSSLRVIHNGITSQHRESTRVVPIPPPHFREQFTRSRACSLTRHLLKDDPVFFSAPIAELMT